MGAKIAIPLGDEEKFGVLVKREEVREAIGKIVTEREDRQERARKACKDGKDSNRRGRIFLP